MPRGDEAGFRASLPSLLEDTDEQILTEIFDPAVGAVIWRRPCPQVEDEFPAYAEPAQDELCALPDALRGEISALEMRLQTLGFARPAARRLETARERICPRFHQDAVGLRLISTYRGPGVELRDARSPATIRRAPTGAVVLLKGLRWPEPVPPLFHRSPPATRRHPRQLLVIDFA